MFKPSKMTRIRIITNKPFFDGVVSALQDIGVMQIETLPENAQSLLTTGEPIDYKQVSSLAQRFRGLESLLIPQPNPQKYSFASITNLMAEASTVKIDERAAAIRKELDALDATEKDYKTKLELLAKLKDFKFDLSILNTRNIVSFIVYGKQLKQFDEDCKKTIKDVIVADLEMVNIYSIRKTAEKDFSGVAEKYKVQLEYIPQMDGKVSGEVKLLESQMKKLAEKRKALTLELSKISEANYPLVAALREQLDIEMEKFEITNKLGMGKSVVVMEGWVPTDQLHRLEALLKKITNDHYLLEHVRTKEHPPTQFHNPVTFKLFEAFIKFYSLPQSQEIDPTIMFAVAFPIFFGFMVGDAGYGLLLLGLALFILHRLSHPPKKSHLPKFITGFVTMLVGPNGLRILAKSIIPGSVIAIFLGIAFNEYFGFHLPYTALFNVEANLGQLLVVAGWIGVFMVCFGFFLGFLNKLAEHDKKHAIAKIGWLFAALGFVIFGLNVLHAAVLGPSNPVAIVSYVLLVAGILITLKFEGFRALMELPSLISHILSYTRLVGILLASVILAEVIDLIFLGSWSHSILLGIVGTVILVVGQLFNIIIAMFEPGIQGARLIYVEFFSKFYEGNGKQFTPFTAKRKQTLAKFKLE